MAGFNFANRADIEATLELIRQPKPRTAGQKPGVRIQPRLTEGVLLLTPSGGIPARSGTQCGYADCTPYYVDADGIEVELQNNAGDSQTFTVYNWASSAIGGNTRVVAMRVFNQLLAVAEDCG